MKKIYFSVVLFIFLSNTLFSQVIYNVNYYENVGNPGGLVEIDNSTIGWTAALNASLAANTWSSNQSLPFSFEFYGTTFNSVKVSANGVLTFTTSTTSIPSDNTNLPSIGLPNNSICAFWESFTTTPPTGFNDIVHTRTTGVFPNRKHWFRWTSFEMGASSYTYFAIVLEETTNRIYIVDMNFSAAPITGTIGLQKDINTAIQWGDSTMTFSVGGIGGPEDNDFYLFIPTLLVSDDAGISKIDTPVAIKAGQQDIKVTLRNYGNNTLTSADIHWEVNGITQPIIPWTGSINAQDSIENILLGNVSFTGSTNTIKVWTSMPNATIDNNFTNDTLIKSASCLGYEGVFTIADSGGDFSSFQEAIDNLDSCGVVGPITFNVAAGTYNETVVIPEILGTSASNRVTFKGAGQGQTILTSSVHDSQTGTLHFIGGDFITFQNLSIENTSDLSQAIAVLFQNASDHNELRNCYINANNSNGSGSIIAARSLGNNHVNYLLVDSCTLEGGENVVTLEGAAGYYGMNNTVSNSTFITNGSNAVYAEYQENLTLYNNHIPRAGFVTYNRIRVENSVNLDIQRNFIANTTGTAIFLININDTITIPQGSTKIINNIIHSTGNGAGLRMDNSRYVDIYHNTIHSFQQSLTLLDSYTGYNIYNNILVCENNYVVIVNDATLFNASANLDNNIYRRKNGYPMSSLGNLSSWKNFAPQSNQNSIDGLPLFKNLNSSDLHVYQGIQSDAGDTTLNILEDFDGEARFSLSTGLPDIGADEAKTRADDASVIALNVPNEPTNVGVTDVKATIRNLGFSQLDSVLIEWSLNDVYQGAYMWNGSLATADTAKNILLGQSTLTYGNNEFKIWTSMPNGNPDGLVENDTLYRTICTRLKGTFTVGGSDADFPNLTEAINRINYCSMDSTINLQIVSDTLFDNVIIPQIDGLDSLNQLIISGVHKDSSFFISAASDLLILDDVSFITIKNLTFISRSSYTSNGISLYDEADRITIDSCRFVYEGVINSSAGVNGIIARDADYLVISNSEFTGWVTGIRLGQGLPPSSDNNIIRNNKFYGLVDYGIHARGQSYIVIEGNDMKDFTDTDFTTAGIYLYDAANPFIYANKVRHTTLGIYLNDINNTYTLPGGEGNIINNMVYTNDVNNYLRGGIYFYLCKNLNVYHNSAYIEVGTALKMEFSSNMDIRNNILSVGQGSVLESIYKIDSTNVLDYNLYYTSDTSFNYISYDIGFNSTSYNLTTWQAAFPAFDVHSVVGNPVFANSSIGDLRSYGLSNYNYADSTLGVFVDFEGDIRPKDGGYDIGADEITQKVHDVQMISAISPVDGDCGGSNIALTVVFRNVGTDAIDSIPFTAILKDANGVVQDSISVVCYSQIAFLEYDTFTIEPLNYLDGGMVTFTVTANMPEDTFINNNTITFESDLLNAAPVIAIGDVICEGEDAIIPVAAISNYFNQVEYGVYDAPVNGNLLASGSMPSVSNLTMDTTLYVDVYSVQKEIGYNANTYPSVFDNMDTATMRFWVYDSIRIDKVSVNADVSGNLVINIRNAQGGIVHSVTQYLSSSSSIYFNVPITINADLGPGYYSMDLAGSTAAGFRYHQYGFQYPFTLPNSIEIIGSGTATGVNANSYYHYFYDWKVSTFSQICERTRTPVFVEVHPRISEITSINVNNIDCFGNNNGSIDVSINGVDSLYNFVWSSGQTTSNIQNLGVGNYLLNIYDTSGCGLMNGDTLISITQPSEVNALFNYTMTGCDSAMMTVDLAGGVSPYQLAWNTGDTDTSILLNNEGNYTLVITDNNNCIDSFTTNVQFPESPMIDVITVEPIGCHGDSTGAIQVTLTENNASYLINWNTGDTSLLIDNLPTGSFTLSVQDTLGCTLPTGDTTIFISEPDSLYAILDYSVSCDSALITATVEGGTQPYVLDWQTGTSDTSILVTTSGVYGLVIVDSFLCTYTNNLIVNLPSTLLLSATSTPDTAGLGIGTATVIPSGGVPPFTYQWNDALAQTTQVASNLEKGVYTCLVRDTVGCEDTISVEVGFPISNQRESIIDNVSIFPNPVSERLNILFETNKNANLIISIYNASGQEVFSHQEKNSIGDFTKTIDVSEYAAGVYWVRFLVDGNILTRKIIVMK